MEGRRPGGGFEGGAGRRGGGGEGRQAGGTVVDDLVEQVQLSIVDLHDKPWCQLDWNTPSLPTRPCPSLMRWLRRIRTARLSSPDSASKRSKPAEYYVRVIILTVLCKEMDKVEEVKQPGCAPSTSSVIALARVAAAEPAQLRTLTTIIHGG